MKRAMRATALSKKITLVVTAFVLAVSSLTASVPFILSERASAASVVDVANLDLWDLTQTRTTGHNELVSSGLHVWTEGATSTDKAAGYYPVSLGLSEATDFALSWTGTGGVPGGQLAVDLNNNGVIDGILVVEPTYGGNIWLAELGLTTADGIDVSSLPLASNSVGSDGGTYSGTYTDWLAVFPQAKVKKIGYSLGSGVLGNGIISDIKVGGVTYSFVDTTAPSAPTITAPGARTWHRTAPIKTTWTAVSDPSGVFYQVAYRYDDGHSFSGSSCVGETIDGDVVYCRSTSSTSRNHSPSPSEQGGVTVWVRAIDGAGNVGAWSTPVHYYYDATAPATSIAVDGLVDNTVDNTFTVSGDATDNLGLNRVYVQLVSRVDGKRYGGTTVNLIPFGTSHHWEQDFNATALGLPEGPVAAHVQVVDMAGNTASAGWTDDFIVDSTAPNLSVDANPVEGATVSGGQVTITGTAESADFGWYRYQLLDANKDPLTFSINGGSAPVVDGTLGSINIDSLPAGAFEGQALADGTYYVRVWAQDKYGNQVGTKNTPYIAQFTVLRTPTPGTGEETGGGTTTPPPTDTEEEEESDGGDSDGVPQTFATPAAINPGAIAGVLGDSTDNTSNDGGNAANGGDVKGTSTEKNLAQAVDTDSSDGTVLGMAWYWWLLIVAAVAAVIWWIVAAIRGRNGEN